MENRTLTCIGCPMGCQVSVSYEIKDGAPNMDTMEVTGNTCPRGREYAISEVTAPTRTVTGTISINNREGRVVPVKTASAIPKDKIFDVAAKLFELSVTAPVKIGDVVCEDICGTGVSLVITNNID